MNTVFAAIESVLDQYTQAKKYRKHIPSQTKYCAYENEFSSFEVFLDGVIRMPVSWDAMLHRWISGYQHFKGMSRHHLQGFRVYEEMNVFEKME
jgi:hypothetical protein